VVVQKLRQAGEPRSVDYLGGEKMLDLSDEQSAKREVEKK
jgi:hypothetical protein